MAEHEPVRQTLAALLDGCARRAGERLFVSAGGTSMSYAEFADATRRLSAGLRSLGIGTDDKIGLFVPNGIPFLLAMLAAARAGALFVPLHEQLTAREAAHIVAHADVCAVLVDGARLPVVRELRAGCPLLRLLIGVDGAEGADIVPLSSLFQSPQAEDAPVRPEDAAAILYTSGTTGLPKGAVLTHRGYVLNATAFAERAGLRADDVVYCVLPLSHLNAQRSSALAAIAAGARLVLEERFSASRFWPRIREQGGTFFSVLPTVCSALLAQPPGAADRRHGVRLCVTPASPQLARSFESRFGVPVVNTYGLTEGMLNVMNFPDPARRRIEAVGKPIAPEVHEVRIVDAEDRPLPAGATGEIVLRSPAVMREYYKNPAATAAVLRGGWLHTGDLGFLDADGYLHFAGRRKEIIRRAGENISPAELEEVLLGHPKVIEAGVVGVPDPVREEEVKACVVLRQGEDHETVPPSELFAYCAARLAAFKVPRFLEYRSGLPRTPATQRVQRHLLREPEDPALLFENPQARPSLQRSREGDAA